MTKITNVPSTVQDGNLRLFLSQVKEELQAQGNGSSALAKHVGTLATAIQQITPNQGQDTSTPNPPTDFVAEGMFEGVFMTWKGGTMEGRQRSVDHAEIWRNETDDLGTAYLVATSRPDLYMDPVPEPGMTYYYWIRFINVINVPSEWFSQSGVMATTVLNPEDVLEALSGMITKTQLAADLLAPINLIDAAGTGLVTQIANLQTDVLDEINLRASETLSLSQQMAAISAGTNTQFDYSQIWYFDTTPESWTGNGTPTITTPGWIRPANHATDPYVTSPSIPNPYIDGTKYPQVRLRIKKTGTPTWKGELTYITVTDTTWDTGGKVMTMPEPTYDSDGIGNLTYTLSTPWVGAAITQISVTLSNAQTSSNYFEIDWVGVGRPSPGASAEAVNLLSTRVGTVESTQVSQSSQMTLLRSSANDGEMIGNYDFRDWSGGYPVGWTLHTGPIVQHAGSYAYTGGAAVDMVCTAGSTTGIQATIATINYDYIDIECTFTLVSGSLSGAGIVTDWRDSTAYRVIAPFNTQFTDAQALGKRCTFKITLKRPVTSPTTNGNHHFYLFGNFSGLGSTSTKRIVVDTLSIKHSASTALALDTLTSRVTTSETDIISQSSKQTALENIAYSNIKNILPVQQWVAGVADAVGAAWAGNGVSGVNNIVMAGGSEPASPFNTPELLWKGQDNGGGFGSGGWTVATPLAAVTKTRGVMYSVFIYMNEPATAGGEIYHGCDTAGGVEALDGSPAANPYFINSNASVLTAAKWYLLYGVIHPNGSSVASTGLSGVYDAITGTKIVSGTDFRMTSTWESLGRTFRTVWGNGTSATNRVWYARPLACALDQAPTPQAIIAGTTAAATAQSNAISQLISGASTINGVTNANALWNTQLGSRLGSIEKLSKDPNFEQDNAFYTSTWNVSPLTTPAAALIDVTHSFVTVAGEGRTYQIIGTDYVAARYTIAATPGRTWRIRVRARTIANNMTISVGFATFDSAGAFQGVQHWFAANNVPLTPGQGWVEYTGSIGYNALTAAAVYIRPLVKVTNVGVTPVTAQISVFDYWDATEEVANASAISQILTNSTTVNGVTNVIASQINQLSVSTGTTAAGMLPNPTFAQRDGALPAGYVPFDLTGYVDHTGAYAYTGGHAVQFTTVQGSNGSGITTNVYSSQLTITNYVDVELVFTLVAGANLAGAGVLIQAVTAGGAYTNNYVDLYTEPYVLANILGRKTILKKRIALTFPPGQTDRYQISLMANWSGVYPNPTAKTIVFDSLQVTPSDTSAGQLASVIQSASATANSLGQVAANWMLKTDVNGYIAGFGLYNTGVQSNMYFNVDNFAVGRGDTYAVQPFVISGGLVAINEAAIGNATIGTAKIRNLWALDIGGGTANFVKANIGTLYVDDIIISNASEDYVSSSTVPQASGFADLAVQGFTTPGTTRSRKYVMYASGRFTGSGGTAITMRGIGATGVDGGSTPLYVYGGHWNGSLALNDIVNPVTQNKHPATFDWSAVTTNNDGNPANWPVAAGWENLNAGCIVVFGNYQAGTIGIGEVSGKYYNPSSSVAPNVHHHSMYFTMNWMVRFSWGVVNYINVYQRAAAPYRLLGETTSYQSLSSDPITVVSQFPNMPRNYGGLPAWLTIKAVNATCISNELSVIALR